MKLNIQAWSLVALVVCSSSTCLGADPTAVSTARDLAAQGLKAFDDGSYEQAADNLIRAYRIVNLPLTAVQAAQALEKLGKLVEASELYLEATRLTSNALWRGSFQQDAQAEAQKRRERLATEIPRLRIEVLGTSADACQLKLDERPIVGALIGAELSVNPGVHRVAGVCAGDSQERVVKLQPLTHEQVTLQFHPRTVASNLPDARAPVAVPSTDGQKLPLRIATYAPQARVTEPKRIAADVPAEHRAGTVRTWGWIGIGVGAAGFAVGGSFGALVWAKYSGRPAGCSATQCPDDYQGYVDTYNAYRHVATAGFIIGAVGTTIGAVVLLSSSKTPERSQIALSATPTSLAIRGRF